MVNNTLAVYSEISESTRKNNAKHFAETMIKENAPYYYDEASKWIASSSFLDNTPKVISVSFFFIDKFKIALSSMSSFGACLGWPCIVA